MLESIAYNMAKNAKGFAKGMLGMDTDAMEDEGGVSILLGSLIGGGMGIGFTHMENQQLKKAAIEEESRYKKLFDDIGPAAANLLIDDIKSRYKQKGVKKIKDKDGNEVTVPDYETYTDENGVERLKDDPEALLRKSLAELANSKL